MNTTTIRPGFLIALKTSVRGGVHYDHEGREAEGNVERWTTIKTVEDPDEHDRACKVRGAAARQVRRLCSSTSFGLLCPVGVEGALDAAVASARALVRSHNEGARYTHVTFYVLKGRIADSDEEAARAIADEVGELLARMNGAIDRLDPKAIRDAASKAREMTAMLDDAAAETVAEAIKQARKAARQIVARVQEKGEAAQVVLADIQRGALEKARIAFLDVGGGDAPVDAPLPVVQQQRFADLDLADAKEVA
jgi:hypothetical protein